MADHFGAIAAKEIGSSRSKLVFPQPQPKNGTLIPLEQCCEAPTPVYKKADSKEELDSIIEELRIKYEPFFQTLSPEHKTTREIISLHECSMREATEEDLADFSRVLNKKGDWKQISLPYYFGPTGNTTHYYHTTFELDDIPCEKSVFICFDGVDYIAEVFINGSFVGNHEGFFGSFEFDISKYIRKGENTLVVTVRNDYVYGGNQGPTENPIRLEGDKMYAATGLGYDDSETGWHHCPPGAGIYQDVRVEIRSKAFISDLFVRPLLETNEYEVWCEVYNSQYAPIENVKLSYSVYGKNFETKVLEDLIYEPITFENDMNGDIVIASELNDKERMKSAMKLKFFKGANLIKLRLPMEQVRKWELDAPYLYEAQVCLYSNDDMLDASYVTFGMRSFTQDTEQVPRGMFYLNGSPIRLRGANTMGFEQQDVLRGDFDALLYDMLMAKACNMNFLRITQRPVQKEIYELCDKIGLMLQTDLPLFSVMRRTKFAEGIRQCEEMERLIRPHASCVLISYMNEPMANGGNRPHRHFVRHEMEAFFDSCDTAVHLLNPDRVIKAIDGDYDPPGPGLPDNHCYCTWYNGHGIDIGKLHRGYWLGVKEDWYYGCGEFGAEGLDPVSLMRSRYPAEWLPQTAEEEKTWEPGRIKDSQSGNMHFFYYDTQDTLEDWITESRKHQAYGTKVQTEAFRRDPNMVTFAIHLFIDAWPSGWMKTIVDCEREPKPAFFTYRDALTPLMINIRNDRKTFFADESAAIELFICNDTNTICDGHKIVCELIDGTSEKRIVVQKTVADAHFGENSSFMQGDITLRMPDVHKRTKYILRAILTDKDGNILHYCDEDLEVFPYESAVIPTAVSVDGEEYLSRRAELEAIAADGGTVIINDLKPGTYLIGEEEVKVKSCGMRALHFVSRKTGHSLVEGFTPYDFKQWYDEEQDMMTPLIKYTFTAKNAIPILTSGNSLKGSAWGQKLYTALACAEIPFGKGKIIVNEVDLDSHLKNPIALKFKNRLLTY